ncbi:MAG: PTS ascorbate transporter subunit IIC [Leptotrichiaceae bacterium]|nr:PTS ascorbate transporter subunit IIC [Leptotrichiaceae bacterium]
MDFLMKIGTMFGQNILTKPEFFVGLLVFIGYLFMGKKIYEAVGGFIKATVGYMILNVGAGGLVVTFRPILAALKTKFQLDAAVIDPYFGLQAVDEGIKGIIAKDPSKQGLAASVMMALLIGFIINILLVLFRKVTKVRTLFITGHIMQQQASTATWMIFFLFPQFQNIMGIVLVGIFAGIYWAVGSNLSVEPTQRLTENAGFAIGHQQMFAIWVADKLAPKLGNPKKKLDDLKLPKWLSMLHDDIIATGLIMMVFFGVIMWILGPEFFTAKFGKCVVENGVQTCPIVNPNGVASGAFDPKKLLFGTYIVSTTLLFAVYLTILKTGVRMFVSELTLSFQGISNKILPGSLPAVDCAASYGFGSPSAVLFGFLIGTIAQFISIAGLLIFRSPIFIITGFVPVFFDNATIAVYADKRGGARAALILSALSGVLQVLCGAVAVALFQLKGGWHGNIDQSTVWLAQGFVMKYLGMAGYVLVIVLMLLIPQIQYIKSKNKEQYYEGTVDLEGN